MLVAAGCGDQTLDTASLESQIKNTLSERTGFAIRSVSCPDEVEAERGARFACTVTTGTGERVRVNVIQEDDEGGVSWRLAGPLKR